MVISAEKGGSSEHITVRYPGGNTDRMKVICTSIGVPEKGDKIKVYLKHISEDDAYGGNTEWFLPFCRTTPQ